MDGRSVGVSRALRRARAPGSVDRLAKGLSRKVWRAIEPEEAVGASSSGLVRTSVVRLRQKGPVGQRTVPPRSEPRQPRSRY